MKTNNTVLQRKTHNLNLFLDWINNQFPGAKHSILKRVNSSQLGAVNYEESPYFEGPPSSLAPGYVPQNQGSDNWFNNLVTKITDAAAQVLPAYANYELQKNAYKIQIERAKRGQPPIDMAKYSPTVKVQHKVDTDISKETENMLWVGGGIIALLFLLNN